MKKILIVGTTSIVGGIETFFNGLFKEKSRIFDISFLSFDKECAFANVYKENGYKIYVVPSRRSAPMLFSKNIKKFFMLHNYFDYIWVNTLSTSMYQIQYYGKMCTSAQIITHSHGTKFENTSGRIFYLGNKILSRLNRKKVLDNTDLFFACSIKAGIALFGDKKINSNNFFVVKNGIETEKFKYQIENNIKIRNMLNIDFNTCVVGMIGRLSLVKNPLKGVEVFYEFNKVNENSVLLVIGEGELRHSVEEKVLQMGLEEKVYFLGLRSDVCEILSAIDVIVMPSLFEGLPLTAIEAQTAGCLCVLSNEITNEVKISDLVRFVDINDSNEKWSQLLKKCLEKNCKDERGRYFEIVRKEKYDRKDTIEFIEKLLCNGV